MREYISVWQAKLWWYLAAENSHPGCNISWKVVFIRIASQWTFKPQTYLSRVVVTSPNGVHSNTIMPREPDTLVVSGTSDNKRITNIESDTQEPEAGTTNLRSNHISVASYSRFIDNHICHASFDVDGRRTLRCFCMTLGLGVRGCYGSVCCHWWSKNGENPVCTWGEWQWAYRWWVKLLLSARACVGWCRECPS